MINIHQTGKHIIRLLIVTAVFLYADSNPLYSQASPTPTPEIQTTAEEDPTKPILLSIRDEYRSFRSGGWANTVIFRIDRLVMKNLGFKGGSKGVIVRFDVPFNTVNRGNVTQKGLGDLYLQALYLPHLRKKYLIAVGSGMVLPTATDRFLGQGKLIFSPSVVPVWYIAKREQFAFIRVQNYFSVAGKKDRPSVNYLLADPTFVHRISRRWWLSEDTEFKWDWKNKATSGISGLQIGRMVRKGYGFWFKPEIAWGPGRVSDFNLKFTFFRLR